jgi:hypothetical protein
MSVGDGDDHAVVGRQPDGWLLNSRRGTGGTHTTGRPSIARPPLTRPAATRRLRRTHMPITRSGLGSSTRGAPSHTWATPSTFAAIMAVVVRRRGRHAEGDGCEVGGRAPRLSGMDWPSNYRGDLRRLLSP